jgi:hypothetical protein
MTDLIVVPQAAHWQRLKRLVLDSISSPITRRVYNLGIFQVVWPAAAARIQRKPQLPHGASRWRRGLGAVSINVRINSRCSARHTSARRAR